MLYNQSCFHLRRPLKKFGPQRVGRGLSSTLPPNLPLLSGFLPIKGFTFWKPSTIDEKQKQVVTSLIHWKPLQGPQTLAFNSEADILFYGGGAGGGKTWLLLGLSLTAHLRSIIFRRQFAQLEEIEDSLKLLAEGTSSYNSQRHVMRLGRRTIQLGAVQLPDDVLKYQGRPHDFIGFDEITHFLEAQFRFLCGWLRSGIPGQRKRIIAAGNPPTNPEGEWVTQFWGPWLDPTHPNPATAGELRWYATIDGKDIEVENGRPFEHENENTGKVEMIQPLSRTFIPALVDDNPILIATGYKTILQNLPEPLRSKLLLGDFNASSEDDPWQVIPTAWVDLAMARWTETPPDVPLSALGVDVARGGADATTITKRYNNWFSKTKKYPGKRTPDGPAVAAVVKLELGEDVKVRVNFDIIGVGAAAYDAAKANDIDAVPLNGSHATKAKDRSGQLTFRNKRAEWHWKFREMLDPNKGDNLMLPPDRELRADLCAPRWKLTVNGIQIEEKDEIKKRIGRSPDVGESVIYSSVLDGSHTALLAAYRQLNKMKQEKTKDARA
jgi:hypothetical protein